MESDEVRQASVLHEEGLSSEDFFSVEFAQNEGHEQKRT